MASLLKKLFCRTDPIRDLADKIYAGSLAASKDPVWYTTYDIPDDFIHRFDVLLYCLYPPIHQGQAQLNQAIFDVCFNELDESVRIAGVGDMSLRKYMKKLMMAFNGRMRAYDSAFPKAGALTGVILRNIYDGKSKEKTKARNLADKLITVIYTLPDLGQELQAKDYKQHILSHVQSSN